MGRFFGGEDDVVVVLVMAWEELAINQTKSELLFEVRSIGPYIRSIICCTESWIHWGLIDRVWCPIDQTCVKLSEKLDWWVSLIASCSLMPLLILGNYHGVFGIPVLSLDRWLNLCKYHLGMWHLTIVGSNTLVRPSMNSSELNFNPFLLENHNLWKDALTFVH